MTDVTQFPVSPAHTAAGAVVSLDQIVLFRLNSSLINLRDKSELFCKANHNIRTNKCLNEYVLFKGISAKEETDNTQVL